MSLLPRNLAQVPKMGKEAEVPQFKLNTGAFIPALGLGTANFVNVDETEGAILTALTVGYRHIDTASFYGSEVYIGRALQKAFSLGLVKREDVFVTTKIWCDSLEPSEVLPAIKKSLSELQLDYVDLYLVHWPLHLRKGAIWLDLKEEDFLPLDMKSVWRAMENLVDLHLTRAIGVSNFNVKLLQKLLAEARIVPAVNQVEMHPLWNQHRLKSFCDQTGIHLTAWSPLGAPGSKFGVKNAVLENPVLKEIVAKHGKSSAQICLKWVCEKGVSAVPKSYNEKRMTDNLSIFDFSLTKEDHEKIETIPQIKSNGNLSLYNGPIKTFEEFWIDEE